MSQETHTHKINKVNPFPDYNFYIQLISKNEQGEFLPFTRYRHSFFNSQIFGVLHEGEQFPAILVISVKINSTIFVSAE